MSLRDGRTSSDKVYFYFSTKRKGRDYIPLPKEQFYTSEDYWNLPEGQRAELIDGKMYAIAPPNRIHQEILGELYTVINNHIKSENGACKVYPAPFAVNLNADDKIWVEPDISVICDQNKLSDQGCKGAPDWIIEIVLPGNPKNDYTIKLFKYRTAGVREYWIVNPMKKVIQTYIFDDIEDSDVYTFDDEIPVHIFDGLTIKISDLLYQIADAMACQRYSFVLHYL